MAPLRRALTDGDLATKAAAARVLEQVGDQSDVLSLRRLSRELKGEHANPDLGRELARRVAPRTFIEDLGRIELTIGDRQLPGTSVRRKALALLTFLLAQPQMASTRDRVLDALRRLSSPVRHPDVRITEVAPPAWPAG
jgi:hypothetical protein